MRILLDIPIDITKDNPMDIDNNVADQIDKLGNKHLNDGSIFITYIDVSANGTNKKDIYNWLKLNCLHVVDEKYIYTKEEVKEWKSNSYNEL